MLYEVITSARSLHAIRATPTRQSRETQPEQQRCPGLRHENEVNAVRARDAGREHDTVPRIIRVDEELDRPPDRVFRDAEDILQNSFLNALT